MPLFLVVVRCLRRGHRVRRWTAPVRQVAALLAGSEVPEYPEALMSNQRGDGVAPHRGSAAGLNRSDRQNPPGRTSEHRHLACGTRTRQAGPQGHQAHAAQRRPHGERSISSRTSTHINYRIDVPMSIMCILYLDHRECCGLSRRRDHMGGPPMIRINDPLALTN